MAVTRIKNNQITDATIFANVKIAPGTIVGSLFNPDVTINSNIAIVGNLNVSGSTSTINSINTLVNDPLVIFNNGYIGTPMYDIGILASRNLQPTTPTNYGSLNSAWVWREGDGAFESILTPETGSTQGAITRTAFANVIIGNTIIQTTATNPSVVEAVDTATGALQVKGGGSFTQNVQVGGRGSVFGSNAGVVAISGNTAVLQLTQLNTTRAGLMITDTVNNGALTLRSGAFGAQLATYGGSNNDIYIQPNNQPSLVLPASNGSVIATIGINSTNANSGAIVVSGSGGIGIGGNINVGTSGSFEDRNVVIQSAKQNDVLVGKNIAKGGVGANVTAFGAGLGTISIGQNSSLFGYGAGAPATGVNSTFHGTMAGNLTTGQNNQFFGYNSGSLVTGGNYNVILGSYDGNAIASLSNQVVISDGAGSPRIRIDNTGNVYVTSSATAIDFTNGALVVQGGVGIVGNLIAGGELMLQARTRIAATASSLLISANTVTAQQSANSVIIGQGIGINAGTFGNTTTIVGAQAAATASTGPEVTLYGYRAGWSGPGQLTTAVGSQSGKNLSSTAISNQFFGYNSGAAVVTGNYNVIIGSNSGGTIDGLSNRIIIAEGSGVARINISDTGSTEITSQVETNTIGTGALIVDGGLSVQKNTRIGGNLTVTGNLNVIGTVSTVNSTFLTVVDPIIELGVLANASVLTSDDGKDRGIRMHYYNGADRSAFVGYQNATGNLVYFVAAQESAGNVMSGYYGGAQFGQLYLSNTAPSTSQLTGVLSVAGGVGIQGRITANNAVIDNNLTASGSGALVTFSPTGAGTVTIAPATKGSIDNMAIGQSTPAEATFNYLTVTNTVTMNGSGYISLQPSQNVIINSGSPGTMDNMFIGNTTPRQATFTAANINQDLVLKAFTSNSVLFMSQTGNLSVDQQWGQFNFQRTTGNTFSGVSLSVGTNGDVYTGTDTLNIRYQGDSYLPQSLITDANIAGLAPGWTVSSSRGTGPAPQILQDGDFAGLYSAFAYMGTTPSVPSYYEIGGWKYVAQGNHVGANGIGGEAQLWTKQSQQSQQLALRVDNNQKATFYGQVAIANSTISTTTSSGAFYVQGGTAIGGNLNVAQGARFNDQQNSNRDFYVRGSNDATLIWASTSPSYNQVVIGNSAVGGQLVTGAKLQINSTDSMLLPSGTEAQRPGTVGYGSAIAGMIRFNTIAGDLEYYDGSKWYQPQYASNSLIIAETFSGNGVQLAWTMTRQATTAATFVAINGTLQQPVSAYSVSGNVITFTEAPAPGDVISARTISSTVIRGLASTYGLISITATDSGTLITGPDAGTVANSVIFQPDHSVGWRGTTEVAVDKSATLIHTFSASVYRSAKYVIQVQNSTNNIYEASEVMVLHDGTNAYRTQFNTISTWSNAQSIGSVTVALGAGNVNLYYSGKTVGNMVKVKADLLSKDRAWNPY